MTIDAGEMALVHRVFRRAFGELPGLIQRVAPGDVAGARAVGDHLELVILVLHHHHSAEDDLLWPKLYARVPAAAERVHQVATQHAKIAALVDDVDSARTAWMREPDRASAARLGDAVTALGTVVGEHLDNEERDVVPLIEQHVSAQEWQEMLDRGAAFLTPRTVRRALVFGGLVLEAADSPRQRAQFLAGLPRGPRMLVTLFSARALAAQRRKLAGATSTR
ncbi:MAG TPA: hemerythrin domain-containing protein [Mycobacterium sp.]